MPNRDEIQHYLELSKVFYGHWTLYIWWWWCHAPKRFLRTRPCASSLTKAPPASPSPPCGSRHTSSSSFQKGQSLFLWTESVVLRLISPLMPHQRHLMAGHQELVVALAERYSCINDWFTMLINYVIWTFFGKGVGKIMKHLGIGHYRWRVFVTKQSWCWFCLRHKLQFSSNFYVFLRV